MAKMITVAIWNWLDGEENREYGEMAIRQKLKEAGEKVMTEVEIWKGRRRDWRKIQAALM